MAAVRYYLPPAKNGVLLAAVPGQWLNLLGAMSFCRLALRCKQTRRNRRLSG